MSNPTGPFSDPHVDDVLSSIRKLVTDEEQLRRSALTDPADAADGDDDEALVLTLDMAVDEPVDEAVPASDYSAADVQDQTDAGDEVIDLMMSPEVAMPVHDDLTVDDEEFADLVREIVREELRGELGDKISANLRKMVRKEINRALNVRIAD